MRFASVVITQKFADSVEEIVADAATRSPSRAQLIDDEVDTRVSSLDQNARRGRKLPELDDDLIRELLVVKQDFRLIYRLNENSISSSCCSCGPHDGLCAWSMCSTPNSSSFEQPARRQ